jgi:broad specificity phosphatase PhoE
VSAECARSETGGSGVRLYLIRHGETEWSRSGRHTGRTDLPLTAHGEDQARSLGPVLQAIPFARVFASPSERARHTCALAGLTVAVEIEPDLVGWNYGAYEGMRSSEIRRKRAGWSAYRDGCPDGESVGEVSARADRLIGRLLALRGDIALFGHGQSGCSLAVRWIGLPVTAGQHLQLDPASFGVLAFNPNQPGLPVIAQWSTTVAAYVDFDPVQRPTGRATPERPTLKRVRT